MHRLFTHLVGPVTRKWVVVCALLGVAFCFLGGQAQANSLQGGDITYRWISGETYEITLTLYRDCSGLALGATQDVQLSGPCGATAIATLNIVGAATEVSPLCAAALGTSTCSGGANPGLQRVIYRANVTLSAQCLWTVAYRFCNRRASANILNPTTQCFLIEATINNTGGLRNNSPTFNALPLPFVCADRVVNFNHSAVDTDGDSIVYQSVAPLTTTGTANYTRQNMTYTGVFNPLNPLTLSSGFLFNSSTGQFTFTPSGAQTAVITVLVREFRNGALIGTTMRDMLVNVISCTNNPPRLPVLTTGNATPLDTTTTRDIFVCLDATLRLNFSVSDPEGGNTVSLTTDALAALPGATFTTTAGNPATGTLTWTPNTLATLGSNIITLTARDNACNLNGFSTVAYNIIVLPASGSRKPGFTGPVEVCNRQPAVFTYTGIPIPGANTFWFFDGATVLSGFGQGPFTVQWNTPGPKSVRLRVEQRNCVSLDSILSVTVFRPILNIDSSAQVSCTGGSDGRISLRGSGSVPPYQFSQNGVTWVGTNTHTFTGLSAGNRRFYVRDSKGCVDSISFTVTTRPQLTMTARADTLICPGESVTLRTQTLNNALGTPTYEWRIVGPNTLVSTAATVVVTPTTTTRYALRVNDNCNVPRFDTVEVTVRPQLTVGALSNRTLCTGRTYSITAPVTGGAGVVQTRWFQLPGNTLVSSAATLSGTLTATTSFRLDVQDACTTISRTVILTAQPTDLAFDQLNITPNPPVCPGTPVTITVTATGGTGVYNYTWSTGQTGASIVRTVNNDQTITVTLNDTCQSIAADVDLFIYAPMQLTTSPDTTVCVGGMVNLRAEATDGDGLYSYTWTPVGGGPAVVGQNVNVVIAPGPAVRRYAVQVQDGCGSIVRDTVTVRVEPALVVPVIPSRILCQGNSTNYNGTATGTYGLPITYRWETSGGVLQGTTPNIILNPSTTTSYNLIVSNACTSITRSFTVTVIPNTLAANAIVANNPGPVCPGTVVNLTASATGGRGVYTYNWSTGQTGASINVTVNANTTYTVTIGDSCQTVNRNITINVLPPLTADARPDTLVCAGASINLRALPAGGNGSYTYSWTRVGFGVVGTTQNVTTVVPAGTSFIYRLQVTDGCGTIARDSVRVNVEPTLTVPTLSSRILCQGNSTNYNGTATGTYTLPITYRWETSGGVLQGTSPNIVLNPTTTTSYNLIVSNACTTITRSFTVTVIPNTLAANPIVANNPGPVCAGTVVNLTASATGGRGVYTYTWSTGQTGANINVTVNANTTYTVTVSDSCQTRTANITINLFPALTVSTSPDTLVCIGTQVNLRSTAAGGNGVYNYQWTQVGVGSVGNSQNVTPFVLAGPTQRYAVQVTDGCGVIARDTVLVTVEQNVSLPVLPNRIICEGNSTSYNGTAIGTYNTPLTYRWETTGGLLQGITPNIILNPATTTSYNLIVTNACTTVTRTFTVNVIPNTLNANNITSTHTSPICAGTVVTLTASASGGRTPYTFNWNTGQTTASINVTVNSTATYTVTIGDSCRTDVESITLTLAPPLTVTVSPDTVICPGGQVNLRSLATGGRGPYTYSWNQVGSGLTFNVRNVTLTPPAGPLTRYALQVVDACGTTFRDTVDVRRETALNIPVIANRIVCVGNPVNLNGTAIGTYTLPLTYRWETAGGVLQGTNPTITLNPATTTSYNLIVSNACTTITRSFTLTVIPNTLAINGIQSSPVSPICPSTLVTLSVAPTGGRGVYTYAWSTGQNTSSISEFVTSNRRIFVTVSDSCQQRRDSIDITLVPQLTVSTSPDTVLCSGGIANLRSTATGGRQFVSGYSYQWSRLNGPTIANTRNTNFFIPTIWADTTVRFVVRVLDSCGTQLFDTVTVRVDRRPSVPTFRPVARCSGTTIQLNGTASNLGLLPVTYRWEQPLGTVVGNAAILSVAPTDTTTYFLFVSTACTTITRSVQVNVIQNNLAVSITRTRPLTVCPNEPVTLTANPTGGRGVYTYSWSTGATTPTITPIIGGPFKIVLTVSDSCSIRRDSVEFNIWSPINVTKRNDTTVCAGGNINLFGAATGGRPGPGGYTVEWRLSGGGVVGTAFNSTATAPAGAGGFGQWYVLTVTDSCGTRARDSVRVNIIQNFTVPQLGTRIICRNNPAPISGTPQNVTIPVTTTWRDSNGVVVGNGPSFLANPPATTFYNYTVASACTSITRRVDIIVIQDNLTALTPIISPAPPYCPGDLVSVTARATGGRAPYTFRWLGQPVGANFTFNITDTTTLRFVVTDTCTNDTSAPVFLPTWADPAFTFSNQTAVCQNLPFTINVNVTRGRGPYTGGVWVGPTGVVAGFGFSLTETALASGWYKFRVLDSCNVLHEDSTFLDVINRPAVDAGPDVTICEGNIGQLTGTVFVQPTAQVEWFPFNFISDSRSRTPRVFPPTSRWYYLRASYLGCPSLNIDSVFVQVNPKPRLEIPVPDTGFCQGGFGVQLEVRGSGGTGNLAYSWSPATGLSATNVPNPFASPTSSTAYQVVITDAVGCRSDTLVQRVTVFPIPLADAGRDTVRCTGDGGVFLTGAGVNGGFGSYRFTWTPSTGLSDPTARNPLATPLTTTTYTLSVTNQFTGCESTNQGTDLARVTVRVDNPAFPNPSPSPFFNVVEVCEGESITLGRAPTGGNVTRYEWFPSLGLSDTTIQSPVATPPYTITYFLKVWNGECPSRADTVRVVVKPRPTLALPTDLTYCLGSSVRLPLVVSGAEGPFTYDWTPIAGLNNPTIAQPIASPTQTTTYVVRISAQGCAAQYFDTVRVVVQPGLSIDADTSSLFNEVFICAGDAFPLPLEITGAGPHNIEWSPTTDLDFPTRKNPLTTTLVPRRYKVRVSRADCVVEDSILVTPVPRISAQIVPSDNGVCQGQPVVLNGTSPNAVEYAWFPPAGLSATNVPVVTANPTQTTTYRLVAFLGGCRDTTFFTLNVNQQADARFGIVPPPACGEGEVSFINLSANAVSNFWDFGDGNSSNELSPTHQYRQAGVYVPRLVASGPGGCSDTALGAPILIGAGALGAPTYTVVPQTDTLYLGSAQVLAVDTTRGVANRLWRMGDGSGSTESRFRYEYRTPGTYQVELILVDSSGCSRVDTVRTYTVLAPLFDVPNVFTPNGDGVGDFFELDNTDGRSFRLVVFDRWGRELFRRQNEQVRWNGTLNGIEQPEGVYYYVLESQGRVFKGSFTLLR